MATDQAARAALFIMMILPGVVLAGNEPRALFDGKFETHPEGFIGLQVHGVGNRGPFKVAWRNIKIKSLN